MRVPVEGETDLCVLCASIEGRERTRYPHTLNVQDVEGEADGDPERRVTVIETSTGTKLTGEEAPKKCELEKWLQDHPG